VKKAQKKEDEEVKDARKAVHDARKAVRKTHSAVEAMGSGKINGGVGKTPYDRVEFDGNFFRN